MIERGAVEGQVFHSSAVRELGPESARDGVEQNLVGLVRKELIRPDEPMFAGYDAFRFRHLLIRDAAYESLPKETRADPPRAIRGLDRGPHGARRARRDRRLPPGASGALPAGAWAGRAGARGARRHASRPCGKAALGRSDFHAARNLLERALTLLPAGAQRDEAAFALAEACWHAGQFDVTFELLAPLTRSADPHVAAKARILEANARILADPRDAAALARAVLDEVLPQLEADGDDGALARARLLESMANWLTSRAEPSVRAARLALAHAQRAGDRRLRGVAAYSLGAAAAWGPAPPAEQLSLIEELETVHGDAPTARTGAEYVRISYLMNRGELDDARAANVRLIAAHLELGEEALAATIGEIRTLIELWDGRPDEALKFAEDAYRRLLELGATSWASTTCVHVAEVRYALGDLDGAEQMALEGEQLGSPEDVVNFAMSKGVRAHIAADRGEHATAEQLAREAVGHALETDFPMIHGDAFRALAYAEHALGRPEQERAALEEALAAYRRKGIIPLAEETERLLAATRG